MRSAWSVRYFVRSFVGNRIAMLWHCRSFCFVIWTGSRIRGGGLMPQGEFSCGDGSRNGLLTPKDMIAYYETQLAWTPSSRRSGMRR